jgi:two-component system cell cycle response regulator DivK
MLRRPCLETPRKGPKPGAVRFQGWPAQWCAPDDEDHHLQRASRSRERGRFSPAARLTAQGYEILQSSEGWDGINRARIERPDLIVIDIKLPDICGIDTARLLKQHPETMNIPIIALTAFARPGDEAHALENGCDAFLAKPINMNNLLRAVDLFLASASLP